MCDAETLLHFVRVNFLCLRSLLSISADCAGLNFVLSVCTILCVGFEEGGGGMES